jgi:hypothetical protein
VKAISCYSSVIAIIGIDIEQLGRNGREAEALLHHGRGDEEAGGNILLAKTP